MAADEVAPPVKQIGDRWIATGSAAGYRLNEDHVTVMNERHKQDWTQMLDFIDTEDACLMTTMRRMLDDSHLEAADERCGKCRVCVSSN